MPNPDHCLHAAVHIAFEGNVGFAIAQEDELRRLLDDRVLIES